MSVTAMVEREQQEYRDVRQSLFGRGATAITRPLGEVVQRVLPPESVWKILHRLDEVSARVEFPVDDHDLDDLAACRRVAEQVENRAKIGNAVSGGTAGLGGLVSMTAEIPATLALAMRNIQATGRAYGFDGEGEAERLFRMRILELAALENDELRRKRIDALEAEIAADGGLVVGEGDARPLIDQVTERLARALAFAFVRLRVAGGLPLVGAAVGATVNASFQGDVSRAARFAFQARRLAAARPVA